MKRTRNQDGTWTLEMTDVELNMVLCYMDDAMRWNRQEGYKAIAARIQEIGNEIYQELKQTGFYDPDV